MTYMKHKGALGDSFEIQKSPYYIENPFAPDKSKSEKNVIDISSPGFFSRPEPKKEPEEVDTRCAAEKLIEKIESGINRVGTVEKVHLGKEPSSQSQKTVFPKNGSGEDKFTVESLMSILNSSSSGKSLATPTQQQGKQKTSTPGNQSAFGLETSLGQFGDFQIQHSLLDSLCSGLVQALTPKGVSMTKDEYDKLLNTLNAMDSEDEEDDLVENGMNENNAAYEGIKCNIDFSELEKASTGFKNLNQKLLLKPIQIDDEDVMAKLSKSARKKLRRRERKREQELESIAQMKNVSKSKGKTKNMTPEQSSRRNSVKSNNSDSSSLDKKMDKRKNKKENGDQNILQTKSERKVKLDTQSVNKTNLKNNDNSPSVNMPRNKNLLPDKDNKTFENPPEVTEENNQMLKKKKKKKKVKKASPVIDISADDSILDYKKVSSCAEYLRKALENNQRKSSENKIIKASPFMDVSADDTLLELEGLSCKVIGDELDSDLEIKLKKKKRLSKEKLCSKYGISQTCSLDKEPVLSINDMLKNETDHAESVESRGCKCEGNLEQNGDDIEKVIDNSEKFDGHSEKVIHVEDTVEKDLCQVRSPPENELDDALNVQSSVEFVPNEIEIDGNLVKDEIKVNSSAAKELIRDFKYFDDAEDSLGKRNDMVVPEISENIPENRVDFQVSPNAVDNGSANKEESKHEKVNIGNSKKSKENKDRDDDSDGSENIVNDIESLNGYDKDNSVMHNVVLDNLDTDKTGDTRNDAMGSVGDEDDIVEGIEIANDFVALNTYHENGKDLHDVDVDRATSDDDKVERVIDASNDVVVLNGKENANCVTDKASAADINNKCNGMDNEYEAKYGTVVGKMESESNVEVDVRSESDTAALCINKDVKDLHKVKVEMNDLTALGTGLSVSNHMNDIGACVNGRVEENVQHIINLKSDVNGVDRKQTFSSDSSDDEVEIKNLNGEFKEEFTKDFEVEQFNQLTSSIENFGENDTSYPEVFQSPACLADRLKLRLRKTSTKNVLDAFTNGK
ncbi:RING finger protein PFF0165c-like [Ruditapes philippinarum]|uniref:RING finger protein PFF0165c-like n=1 Tax=Ruditapes philippinarum TaxID=129788 RepID=UPI00295B8870|nr:RING finger protein PFF0165c-like [Ruditapes philippinarum]